MSVLEQTLADIGEEVEVAGQDGNGYLQGSDTLAGGLGHGTAEIAHDRARRAEGRRNELDARKDEVRTCRGRLPGAHRPATPTRQRRDHRAAAIFTRAVEPHRP